jgi:flagellar basal-body rod protein FlgB
MLDRLADSLDFQAQALVLRSERQRLIASNIANADTPGYVAREMDFASALRQATSRLGSPDAGNRLAAGSATAPAGILAATQPGHLAGAGSAGGAAPLTYAVAAQTNIDRNSVDMDRERASFADNTVKYEATLRFINGQLRTMLSAITGQ